jgi:hypothetical protein
LRAWRNKAALQKPMLQQLRNPLAVTNITLASGHLLQVTGVHQQHLKTAFPDIENRLPVNSGRLHGYVSDSLCGHPIRHHQNVSCHSSPVTRLLLQSAAGFHPSYASFDRCFVYIQTGTAKKNVFHDRLLNPHPPARGTSKRGTICPACSRPSEATIWDSETTSRPD